MAGFKENPDWARIWDELENEWRRKRASADAAARCGVGAPQGAAEGGAPADELRRCHGDGGLAVVLELMPGSPDFEFVPMEAESCLP